MLKWLNAVQLGGDWEDNSDDWEEEAAYELDAMPEDDDISADTDNHGIEYIIKEHLRQLGSDWGWGTEIYWDRKGRIVSAFDYQYCKSGPTETHYYWPVRHQE